MQELIEKGQKVEIITINNLKIIMCWKGRIDYDLIAAIKYNDGKSELLYAFGNRGNKDNSPYILTGLDEGAGEDDDGPKEEFVELFKYDPNVIEVVFGVMDYNKVQAGTSGRFDTTDLKMVIEGQGFEKKNIVPVLDKGANICGIGKLTNNGSTYVIAHEAITGIASGWGTSHLTEIMKLIGLSI